MANFQKTESNPWNPFVPTKRDIQRSQELSKKNALLTGIVTFLAPFYGMLYLNRGVNCLKIFGYMLILMFAVVLMDESPEQGNPVRYIIRLSPVFLMEESPKQGNPVRDIIVPVLNIMVAAEQVNSIYQARKRI